jgi:FkbH-like protein
MSDDLRERLAAASDRGSLLLSLAGREPRSLTGREAERVARRLAELAPPADLRLLLLGNHTLDALARSTAAAALCRGVVVDGRVGPFGQHVQMLLDPALGLAEHDPQAIFLSLDLERLLPELPAGLAELTTEARRRLVDHGLRVIDDWVELAKGRTSATLLVGNFWRPRRAHLGLADAKLAGGEAALYGLLNARLLDAYADDPRVHVVDVDHAVATVGRDAASDPRMAFLAKLAWSEAALPVLGDLLARYLAGLVLPPRKCLVLDLDNTLWGGVLGEEGPDGIRIAEGDPVGEAFRAFQTAIKGVQQRGLLLAACSKNNPGDVEEVFRLRSDMPLKLADFAAKRVNWEPKHQNIRAIAAELNIGTDSLVFIDDNPAECELVRQMLPEVEVVALPKDPSRYAGLLLDLPSLERLEIAAEDRRKTEQYQEQAEREAARVTVGSDMAAYLASLGTEVTIWRASRAELTRVHQLFAKTNQFNLTTRRYKPADIEGFLASPDWRLEVVSAKDRFGDLGIIAALLLERRAEGLVLDSLVMSCRAMGRSIESVIANRIKAIARAERPGGRLLGEFRPTAKNMPAADFFDRQGFLLVSSDEAGNRQYSLGDRRGGRRARAGDHRQCAGRRATGRGSEDA